MKEKWYQQTWVWLMLTSVALFLILGLQFAQFLPYELGLILRSDIWTIVGSIGTVIAVVVALLTYTMNVKKEKIRDTLSAFPQLRKENGELILQIASSENSKDVTLLIKRYLSQMEHFAVGVNSNAYDINIVNRMSGGMLITQYESRLKNFIKESREKPTKTITSLDIYIEYEKMMKKLYELRGKTWEN